MRSSCAAENPETACQLGVWPEVVEFPATWCCGAPKTCAKSPLTLPGRMSKTEAVRHFEADFQALAHEDRLTIGADTCCGTDTAAE